MTLLDIDKTYAAEFITAGYIIAAGRKGRGTGTRGMNYCALNYELKVYDDGGRQIGTLPGGFAVTHTSSHNSPLVRFFRAIGIFRAPEEFDPSELEGLEVRISVNNICDGNLGLRCVVDQFHPAKV